MPEVELCPGRWVGDNHPVFVIAELGQNHQVINHVNLFYTFEWHQQVVSKCDLTFKLHLLKGDVSEAKKMIAAAAEAGADCVKFQKSCLKVIS